MSRRTMLRLCHIIVKLPIWDMRKHNIMSVGFTRLETALGQKTSFKRKFGIEKPLLKVMK